MVEVCGKGSVEARGRKEEGREKMSEWTKGRCRNLRGWCKKSGSPGRILHYIIDMLVCYQLPCPSSFTQELRLWKHFFSILLPQGIKTLRQVESGFRDTKVNISLQYDNQFNTFNTTGLNWLKTERLTHFWNGKRSYKTEIPKTNIHLMKCFA